MIKPFLLDTPQSTIDDLNNRIRNTRWPEDITQSGWSLGTNHHFLKELMDYWLNTFKWKTIEAELNTFPNYIAEIDGHQIHFLHIKGKGENSVPLIITHGWPGSFLEMLKLIPLLTEDDVISFDLVIPSVIGFGLSSKSTNEGCNSAYIAELWHQLMEELGYNKYVAQGGDIGSGISTWLTLKYPENIIGLHLNYISGSYKPHLKPEDPLIRELQAFQQYGGEWSYKEGAYAHIHSTKPATLAFGLNDSPVGLCAWIVEKIYSWSDHDADVSKAFTNEEILANVTLYWITQSIQSSIRIYHENSQAPLIFNEGDFVKPPVAFAKFPKELPTPPRSLIEKGFNIRHWTEMSAGGHFAAMEQPALLANDIRDFVAQIINESSI